MCGAALHIFLLLFVGAATVSRTRAEVTAPTGLVAEAERPLLLSCNVTFGPGDTLMQVRWYDGQGQLLLAYQLPEVSISDQDANVQLVASRSDGSSIRIVKLQPDGDGCYRCAFDIFPLGQQEGTACVQLTGRVHLEGNRTAVSGQPLTLSCRYSIPGRVQQVLWSKRAEEGVSNAATVAWFHEGAHPTVEQAFQGRVSLSPSLGHSNLTLLQPRAEDQACYTCHFHTFPEGSRSATACLAVHVLPQTPQLTHSTSPTGDTQVNCTARSRPLAQLSWEVGGANATPGPPAVTWSQQSDGTTTVTSTLLLLLRRSETPGRVAATCVVRHPGLQEPLRATLDPSSPPPPTNHAGSSMVVVLALCGAAVLLVLGLAVCLCRSLCCVKVSDP
ncbi:nectin-3-like isoform X3 [Nelusetta ayraudi]|uniref:nectin-3-like isoform X3 n=1 Tax=Nelusetta ayraudi TaxID=303726 RepID=UPI003F7279C2